MKRQLLSIIFAMLLILACLGVARAQEEGNCPAPNTPPDEVANCRFNFEIKVTVVGRGLGSGSSSLNINGVTMGGGAPVFVRVSAPTSEGLEVALSDCMSLAQGASKGNNRLRLIGISDYNFDENTLESSYSVIINENSIHSLACELI